MSHRVTDFRSNKDEQIAHAAEELARSPQRVAVFEEVYRGRKSPKTAKEIADATGLKHQRVLDIGRALEGNGLIVRDDSGPLVAFGKDPAYAPHRDKILRLAKNPSRLEKQPRNSAPRTTAQATVTHRIVVASRTAPRLITVDDIDSFSKVRGVKSAKQRVSISEDQIKQGFNRVIGETGTFKDWGGEINDVFTTQLRYKGQRRDAAFAFKGPAQTGKLTPGKMGTNGDQVQRLFGSPASVYVVQYVGQVDQSIYSLMESLALAESIRRGRGVAYCVIDGHDTSRMMEAYQDEFR